MTAFERMMFRSNSIGTTKEQMRNNTREEMEILLQDDPSYQNAEIIRGDNVVGSINLRMDNRKIKNDAPQMDTYSSLSEKIKLTYGDVLHTTEVEDGERKESYWLCIDEYNFHGIHRENLVEECNYYLTFQNKETLKIHGRWCSVRSPYSSGVDEGKTVSTGDAKFDITLPYDEETKLFHKDYRFIIDFANNKPIPYKIIRFDGVTNRYTSRQEGFLTIKVGEDQIQDDDNWDLMIADYIEPTTPPSPIAGICEITYKGEPIMKIGGSSKKFTAVFKDNDGNELTGITPNWSLDFSAYPELGNQNKITILSAIGNDVVIDEIPDDDSLIGKTFVLRLEANDGVFGEFEYGLTITIADSF